MIAGDSSACLCGFQIEILRRLTGFSDDAPEAPRLTNNEARNDLVLPYRTAQVLILPARVRSRKVSRMIRDADGSSCHRCERRRTASHVKP